MTNERKEYRVQPDRLQWKLTGPAVNRSFGTQEMAIDAGVAQASANPPSELFIHGEDGQIRDRRTYGDDPRGTKG